MIYLDSHSTTRLDPKVFRVIKPWLTTNYGNPSSPHSAGRKAREAIEKARVQVAQLINAPSENIFFTNSATESNNIALKGMVYKFAQTEKPQQGFIRIISSNSEHSSVYEAVNALYNHEPPLPVGGENLNITQTGDICFHELQEVLKKYRADTSILSLIAASNEVGTIHSLYNIGNLCKKYNTLFHADCAQLIGKSKIDVDDMNIFSLSASGHKIHGPMGAGFLYVRDPDKVSPILNGGYQNILSSGTISVAACVGLGRACELLMDNEEENERIRELRDLLLERLQNKIPMLVVNGTMENRLPNNLNVSLPYVPSELIIDKLNDVGICVSGGSACQSESGKPSHVLLALGNPHPDCSVRFGLSKYTTKREIVYTANKVIEIYNRLGTGNE